MIDKPHTRRSSCPISSALEVVGDSWSLLIVRDMLFGGARTFMDFVASNEGIATNILANRLSKLQKCSIITSVPNPHDKRGQIYSLTPKGIDLIPVLMELSTWGTRHEEGQPPNGILDLWKTDRQGFLDGIKSSLAV